MRAAWIGLLGLSFLLTDCVGLEVVAGTVRENSGAKVGLYNASKRKGKNLVTRAAVLEKMGEPRRRFVRHGVEHWVYNDGLLWQGVVVYAVVVPLPVLLPVGMRRERLQFKQDSLMSCTTGRTVSTAFGYFCGDNGCRAMFGARETDNW